ncbi:ATP synthase F1 subunit epsilon [Patescibacteria group bacterium]|nr:ATP synthase F1 subunit epsilon [Patescibacteria group bacterium]
MANNTFLLEILSPEGEILKDEASEVILPTQQGEIAVLPNHAPIFTKLASGEITIKKDNKEIYVAITGGFLEVNENSVNILADYAIRSEKIEEKKAEEAKKRAEEVLKQKEKLSEVDFITAEKDLRKSILELHISEKVRKRHRPS